MPKKGIVTGQRLSAELHARAKELNGQVQAYAAAAKGHKPLPSY